MENKPYNNNRNNNWKNKPKNDNNSGGESKSTNNNGNESTNNSFKPRENNNRDYKNTNNRNFSNNNNNNRSNNNNSNNNNFRKENLNNKNTPNNKPNESGDYKKDGLASSENKKGYTGRNRRPNRRRYNPHANDNARKNNFRNYQQQKPKEPIVYEICPICEKEIQQPLYAIKELESGKNAHFECIQKKVLENEKLEMNEKLYYLGGGAFGIVKEKRQRGRLRITTLKRIQYSEKK